MEKIFVGHVNFIFYELLQFLQNGYDFVFRDFEIYFIIKQDQNLPYKKMNIY